MQTEPVPNHCDIYSFIDPLQYDTPPLQNQVAIVTGASRGIGHTIAITLAKAGAAVFCVARSSEDLDRTVDAIKKLDVLHSSTSSRAWPIVADVAAPGAGQSTVEAAYRILRSENLSEQIDILVNNAGLNRFKPFYLEAAPSSGSHGSDNSLHEWWRVLQTNLLGSVQFTHAVLPSMLTRNSGTIISLGSRNACLALPYQTAYSASKAALTRFHADLQAELDDRNDTRQTDAVKNGIASFIVQPGDVATTFAQVPGVLDMRDVRQVHGLKAMLEKTKGMSTEKPELVAWTIVKLVVDPRARELLAGRYVNAEQDLGVVLARAAEGVVQTARLYELKIDEL